MFSIQKMFLMEYRVKHQNTGGGGGYGAAPQSPLGSGQEPRKKCQNGHKTASCNDFTSFPSFTICKSSMVNIGFSIFQIYF